MVSYAIVRQLDTLEPLATMVTLLQLIKHDNIEIYLKLWRSYDLSYCNCNLDPCRDDACNGNYCTPDLVGGITCDCSTTGFTGASCDIGKLVLNLSCSDVKCHII